MSYEYLDYEATADLAVRAAGKTLKEAFESAGEALINAMAETGSVEEQEIKLVDKKAEDLESLLYDFLEDIVYFHDAENIIFKSVKITDFNAKNNSLRAVLKGEIFNASKHEAKNSVKAVTYFGMKIVKKKNCYEISFTVDL